MSHNSELRERDKKFKELQQEVRVLMENIKSDTTMRDSIADTDSESPYEENTD